MLSLKQTLLLGITLAPGALAHTTFTNFYVNGVDQGNGTCVRMSKAKDAINSPIADIEGTDMACGVTGLDSVSRTCPIPDGADVTFKFDSIDRAPGKNWYIDPSHKGPCAIYAKKVDSPTSDPTGDGWFKLWEQGFDGSKWCTENMIANKGLISVKLPSGLQGGYYYLRPELLALHAASDGDPQFYTGCAQVFLEGNGNLTPDTTASIPGYVKKSDQAMTWNIYYGTSPSNYPTVGPKVSTFSPNNNLRVAQTSQTIGLKPEGCIIENANWCGFEVPDYTDEDSCWASSENCWDQNKGCWDSVESVNGVIYDGCEISQKRCEEIQSTCKNKVFPGPPNKGKVLTAAKSTINAGNIPAAGAVNGGSSSGSAPAAQPQQSAPAASSSAPAPEQPAASSSQPAPEGPKYSAPTPTPSTSEAPEQPAQTPTTPTPVGGDDEDDEGDYSDDDSEEVDDQDSEDEAQAPATTPAPEPNEGPVVYVTEYVTEWKTVATPYTGSRLARRAHVHKHIKRVHKHSF
ncbi:Apoptosis-inducing factor A [Sphaceloma murrayae]|uniref:AA9 family lytic polysaccharide monooxygenase n=1 Tax=Sphaceloma murrayae TaxID=2082308 RepID=A0A2K1R301_9PEZI|nr:Apoptosis-inducing factor A [Sphaceloma murrayae]